MKYINTDSRSKLIDQDKLGVNESYEARLRGTLSIYSNLIGLINDSDISDSEKMKLIYEFTQNSEENLSKMLQLLESSENDRTELTNKILNFYK
jgi:hypothetical protein